MFPAPFCSHGNLTLLDAAPLEAPQGARVRGRVLLAPVCFQPTPPAPVPTHFPAHPHHQTSPFLVLFVTPLPVKIVVLGPDHSFLRLLPAESDCVQNPPDLLPWRGRPQAPCPLPFPAAPALVLLLTFLHQRPQPRAVPVISAPAPLCALHVSP